MEMVSTITSLITNVVNFAGGLLLLFGAVTLGTNLKDHNGPGISSGACNFLQAGNLTMLMLLHGLYKVGGIHQGLMCTSVQPSKALTQQLNVQGTIFQINAVQVSDFQLTTSRRFQVLCKLDHAVVIEVQTGDTIIALRVLRFFLALPEW